MFGYFLAFSATAFANSYCPAISDDPTRANKGSTWNVPAVINEMQHHPHSDLVIVTAHRGSWEYCPENSIEGVLDAMDKKAESIEVDVRVNAEGKAFLTHDWDLRGEALNVVGSRNNNNIYALGSNGLENRLKPDRYGNPATDQAGNPLYFQSFSKLLQVYLDRARAISGGVNQLGQVVKGAPITVDIKGGEPKLSMFPNSDQYVSLIAILKEVRDFNRLNNVEIDSALIFKINLKEMTKAGGMSKFTHDIKDLQLPYPKLIFIIYPDDIFKNPTSTEANLDTLVPFFSDGHYVLTDWQNRNPGGSVNPLIERDQIAGRSVGAFISYNAFPEGFRVSDGTCTLEDSPKGTKCGTQPINGFASAAIEYFFPPERGPGLIAANTLTTDMFQNAINYLKLINKHNTKYIE
jgi:hypothetical protein